MISWETRTRSYGWTWSAIGPRMTQIQKKKTHKLDAIERTANGFPAAQGLPRLDNRFTPLEWWKYCVKTFFLFEWWATRRIWRKYSFPFLGSWLTSLVLACKRLWQDEADCCKTRRMTLHRTVLDWYKKYYISPDISGRVTQGMTPAQAASILHKINAVDSRLNGCADYCVMVSIATILLCFGHTTGLICWGVCACLGMHPAQHVFQMLHCDYAQSSCPQREISDSCIKEICVPKTMSDCVFMCAGCLWKSAHAATRSCWRAQGTDAPLNCFKIPEKRRKILIQSRSIFIHGK